MNSKYHYNDIDYINFVFATDEYSDNAPKYLKQVLDKRNAYQITGFTYLGNPSQKPLRNFTLIAQNYKFTYYSDNPSPDIILSDSFV